jgi:hypothetical protein
LPCQSFIYGAKALADFALLKGLPATSRPQSSHLNGWPSLVNQAAIAAANASQSNDEYTFWKVIAHAVP